MNDKNELTTEDVNLIEGAIDTYLLIYPNQLHVFDGFFKWLKKIEWLKKKDNLRMDVERLEELIDGLHEAQDRLHNEIEYLNHEYKDDFGGYCIRDHHRLLSRLKEMMEWGDEEE